MVTLVRLSAVLDSEDPLRASASAVVWDLIPHDFAVVQRSYDEWVASLGGVRYAPVQNSPVRVIGPADDVDETTFDYGALGPTGGV